MNTCLKYYPYNGTKSDKKLYKVYLDVLENDEILEKRGTRYLLQNIFEKSNCLVGMKDLEYYKDIKESFGYDCKPKNKKTRGINYDKNR